MTTAAAMSGWVQVHPEPEHYAEVVWLGTWAEPYTSEMAMANAANLGRLWRGSKFADQAGR